MADMGIGREVTTPTARFKKIKTIGSVGPRIQPVGEGTIKPITNKQMKAPVQPGSTLTRKPETVISRRAPKSATLISKVPKPNYSEAAQRMTKRKKYKGKYIGPDKYKGVIPKHLRSKYKGKYFGDDSRKGLNT